MTNDPDADESRIRSGIASVRDVLRGIFHSRHLDRPPED